MNARTVRVMALMIGCLLLVTAASGQAIQNGTFDTDLSSWIDKGAVTHLDDGAGDGFVMFEELGDGARSRIYQDIPISSGQNYLSFRYRLSSAPVGRTIAVPPDSFAAKLTDPTTGERVVVPLFCDPLFGQSYFYTDSDGQKIYHDPYVSVTGPDAENMYTVVLNNLFTAMGQTVRVEFGLASTDNGVSTFAVLDDVVVGGRKGDITDYAPSFGDGWPAGSEANPPEPQPTRGPPSTTAARSRS